MADPRPQAPADAQAPEVSRRYRDVIGRFASGVAVVTAMSAEGPRGMTANALCSLSLDPVLLLVCFDRSARTWPAVQASGRFAVNILSEEQHGLSGVFASKRDEAQKWDGVPYSLHEGVPVLGGVLAWLACELRETHPGGDHIVGIGEVLALEADPQALPLVWYRGNYGALHRERPAEAELPD